MNRSSRIVVVGSLNHDIVVMTEAFPAAGQTVMGQALRTFCGGKGANQAFAVGRLGAGSVMVGQVGNDAAGEAQLQNLASVGVDTTGVFRDPQQPTGTAIIGVDARRENRIIVVPGANRTFSPAVLVGAEQAFQQADFLLLQLEVPMDTVEAAARMATAHGARVMLDPAPAAPLSDELLRQVEYLTPNLSELAALTGRELSETSPDSDIVAAARLLCQRGAKKVIAKLGSRGAMLVTLETVISWPAHRVEVVDTTAAGDAFNGAFVSALASGVNEKEAGAFAVAAAAISVTRSGAQVSMPSRAEVESFLKTACAC